VEPISFGKYQLQERLGEGGMAVVWRAKLFGPRGFEKTLVLKQIRRELAERREFVDLFVAEAKLTVALTHANIVPVYELGMLDGTYFLALELVDGPPLAEIIAEGPMPPPLAGYVVEQVLRGLDYAHRRGVVHRDLSSANVLVSRDGEVKIVDFGIAAAVDARGPQGGSRGYVAPEQEAGGAVDARSDLYALGVLLWELVSGRRFDGSALYNEPLQAIVARATASDPEARYTDAAAMLAAVSRFLRSATGATTQAELGALVRRRCPDVPRASDAPSVLEAPKTDAGPRTVPTLGRSRAVTFATRIEPPPSRTWARVALVAMAIGLAAIAVAVTAGLRRRTPARVEPPPRARLELRAVPADAQLLLDGKPIAAGAVQVAPGTHVVAASAKGLRAQSRSLELAPGGRADLTFTLERAPVQLAVKSEPAGAEVLLGDRLLGTTPLTVEVAGDARGPVRLRKRDYVSVERPLSAKDGVAAIVARLQPLPRGELTLGAVPWAHVTIDGEKKPDTPLAKLSIAAGSHAVHLSCPPTGRELRFTIQIEPGKELRRVADLRGEPHLIE
jgi:serine/threonine-protein kinase